MDRLRGKLLFRLSKMMALPGQSRNTAGLTEGGGRDLDGFLLGSRRFYTGLYRMMFDRKSTPCPACSSPVEVTLSVFRLDFRCPHCGAELKVSPPYTRLVVLLGVLLGYALAWVATMRGPRFCFMDIPSYFYLLCLPFTFLILSFLCRIAPFLVRPTLVPRRPFESHLTTLNLSSDPKDHVPIP